MGQRFYEYIVLMESEDSQRWGRFQSREDAEKFIETIENVFPEFKWYKRIEEIY